jgi:hypothetical protein
VPTGHHGQSLTFRPAGVDLCGAGCDSDHEISVLSCLLALTLLMLSRLLTPPRVPPSVAICGTTTCRCDSIEQTTDLPLSCGAVGLPDVTGNTAH